MLLRKHFKKKKKRVGDMHNAMYTDSIVKPIPQDIQGRTELSM